MPLGLMIVDNDHVNSFVLKNIILRNYSEAEVKLFPDGEDALKHLDELDKKGQSFPDVILLDIYMPLLDGFEFLDRYVEHFSHKNSLIFAMSSSLNKEDQQRANNYDVVKGFITKPLIYNNIQFIIETYLKDT
ncbi:MAG TPA: hypothetical protein DCG19_06330 [Cryomorphaceae bacterium]|nr:hypothetical protein [Owenweeksia sp.]HAD97005.1 hypothetical protein [Cryomorphaceae bacterium]HBF20667.1 hypothetical protein [Cryomorphaceae bacterium]|tara:strand:- start:2081 stop:2479 length:399 start_codon:yes stop_codon:yes gene_type:complete